MGVNELSQFEDGHGLLAVEDGLEAIVGVDMQADLLILKVMVPDIGPDLLGQFGAREGRRTDDGSEGFIRSHRLEECSFGLWFRLGLLCGGFLDGTFLLDG